MENNGVSQHTVWMVWVESSTIWPRKQVISFRSRAVKGTESNIFKNKPLKPLGWLD